jgi:hypothetical protein
MKIPIVKDMPLEEVKQKIESEFPQYTCSFRSKNMLVVKASSTAGAIVVSRKNKAIVNEGFPTMGGQMLFVLCIVGLGVLIPMIIYFSTMFKGQKAVRVNVAELVKKNYGENPDVLDSLVK